MPKGIWLRWFRLQTIFTRCCCWCNCLCCCCCCCHILRWQFPGHQENGHGEWPGSGAETEQSQPIDIDSYSRECIYTTAQICGTEVRRWRELAGFGAKWLPLLPSSNLTPVFAVKICKKPQVIGEKTKALILYCLAADAQVAYRRYAKKYSKTRRELLYRNCVSKNLIPM